MKVYIDKFDDLGNGIAKISNKICFIKHALPGETLEIEIIKDNKKYSKGKINNIITSSSLRVNPVCQYYLKCGGCNFLHLKHDEEINFKKNKIIKYFNKLDYFFNTINYNYRNKISLHIQDGKIGYFEEKTNDLIPINNCYLVKDKINKIIEIINKYIDNNSLGNITIRVNQKEESLVSINGNYKNISNLVNINIIDNLIYNDKVLKGNNYFYENILNYTFKVNYKSFFQVNILGLEKMVQVIKDFLENKNINKALDLYSGTSVFGIFMSPFVNEVVSIESNINASNDAKENKKMNNINNLEIINGLVEDNINKFQNIDLVLVDPARKGLDVKTINYLKKIASNYLIYIACGIDSLKRDIALLSNTYSVSKIYGIDMFPCTNHIESVVLLSLKTFEK